MEEFEDLHPDVKLLPDDIKELRFNAAEKYRKESLQLAIDQREKIINDEIKKNNENKNNMTQGNFQSTGDEKMDKLLEEQKKQMEKIKNKQRQEISQIIEEQFKREQIAIQNREKEKKQKEKEMRLQKEIAEKRLTSLNLIPSQISVIHKNCCNSTEISLFFKKEEAFNHNPK